MRYLKYLAPALALIAAAISVSCLPAQTAKSSKPETTWKTFTMEHADFTKIKWGNDEKTTLYKGHVKFTHGDTTLTSDEILYDVKVKTATSPGSVNITDPECDITGNSGFADFKKKLGIIEGKVVMLLKPKLTPEEEKARQDKNSNNIEAKIKEQTTVTCPKLEYQYKTKIATATGGVLFTQRNRTANADKAIYDVKAEKLTLIGHVKAVDEDGQVFASPDKVIISLKKGDEWMEATNASGSFKVDLDEE